MSLATNFLKKCKFVADAYQVYPMDVLICLIAITHFIYILKIFQKGEQKKKKKKKSPWKLGKTPLFVFLKGNSKTG